MVPLVFKTSVGREERPGCVRFAHASAMCVNRRAAAAAAVAFSAPETVPALPELEGDRMRVRYMTVVGSGGCGARSRSRAARSKSALDEKLTPEPTTVTVEATVAAVGASVEGTLTKGFPDTLPLWPGATVTKSKTTKTPQGTSYSAILTTPDPYADVLAGVGEGLKQADWKVEATRREHG